MIGTRIYKNDMKDYTKWAIWCNENNAHFEDRGQYYEIVENKIPQKTEEEIQAELTQVVQDYMDNRVKERNYDSIFTACSYINSTDPVFSQEAKNCLEWRDKVWRKCYDILNDVKARKRGIPTAEELLEEIPKLVW